MASPPIPPQLEHLATRPFSFYPAIVGVEHNEWLYRNVNWSEILVVNCRSGSEVWISRRYIGEVARVEDPVLIVGLTRELEYKSGMIVPFQRRVIEMPVAVGGTPLTPAEEKSLAPASIVGIRTASSPTERLIFKLIGGAVLVAIVAYLFAVNLSRERVVYTARDQTYMGLNGHDDRTGVVLKLGEPATDRWHDAGELQYEALYYPQRKVTVVLMGSDRKSVLYIGAMDDNWKPVHSIPLRSGGDTASLLRNLRRF
jgi:hypothetical protein